MGPSAKAARDHRRALRRAALARVILTLLPAQRVDIMNSLGIGAEAANHALLGLSDAGLIFRQQGFVGGGGFRCWHFALMPGVVVSPVSDADRALGVGRSRAAPVKKNVPVVAGKPVKRSGSGVIAGRVYASGFRWSGERLI